ncbi:hypothetical protein AB6A40_007895 [Gnathostoma spinigerum]|uniref:Uncharacterized protein n=1 Tax=Gnathostoma spinigerum TaxID=75299 RepID=A0ABD6EN31_9BILA
MENAVFAWIYEIDNVDDVDDVDDVEDVDDVDDVEDVDDVDDAEDVDDVDDVGDFAGLILLNRNPPTLHVYETIDSRAILYERISKFKY